MVPPPRLCTVGGEGQDEGYPPCEEGRGGRSLPSAQGRGRMDGKGFPINGGVDGWRDFPVNGRKMDGGWFPASPPLFLCLWPGTAAGVSPFHGVELGGFPHPWALLPCAHCAGPREDSAGPGLPSRNGFSRGGAGREGPFPEPLGQTHCLPGRQQR